MRHGANKMKKLYLINDICVCCGAPVDEGTMVCQRCLDTGVHKKRSKWIAYINVGKQFYWLGSYDKYEEAVAARKAAEKEWKKKLYEQMESEPLEAADP